MLKTLIISWIVATVSTDKNETDDKMHRLPLKRNTSRREVSLMFDKVEREGEDQFEMEERFNKNNSVAYTGKYGAWIFRSNVLSNSRFDNHTYIIYAIPGERFTVRSWSLNDTALNFTLKEGSMVRLNASFNEEKYNVFEDTRKRLVFKYNLTSREAFMIFNNVCSEDEGQYEMEESLKKRNGNTYVTKYGAWIFHLFVLKHDEIKRGNIGEEIIILKMNESTTYYPRFYHYSQLVTVLRHGDCDITSNSQFYGRLRCERDKINNRYKIKIQNVSPTDTGLYRVNAEGHDTDRCFLYITGSTVDGQLNTVTIQQYINMSTESYSSKDGSILWHVLVYVIPIVTGAVGVTIMISCLVLIHNRNSRESDAVQCLILETRETESAATPSTLRPLPIPPREHSSHQSNTIHFSTTRHHGAAIPTKPTSADTTYSGTLSTELLKSHKHRPNVAKGIAEQSKSACDKETEDLTKNCTAGDFGKDEYQMGDDHRNAYPGLGIDSVSTITPILPLQGTPSTRNNVVQETKDKDGYDTVENAVHMSSAENVKVSEDGHAWNMQEEPEEQNAENVYDHINF